jgi:hypothetical protein
MPKPKHEIPTISVHQMRQALEAFPDHFRLSFGGLHYQRIKQRDTDLVLVEFAQMVYLDDEGRVAVDNFE